MEEKKWEHPKKPKKKIERHVIVCQSCLKLSTDKGMSESMYFYVDRGDHRSVDCIDCIEKYNLKVSAPYKEPSKAKGRPKGSPNTKKTTKKTTKKKTDD